MTDKKTILYLRDTLKICGPGKTIINTCRLLDTSRYKIVVFATRPKSGEQSQFIQAVTATGAECFPLSMRGFLDFSGIREIVEFVKKHDIKMIQTHDAQTRRVGFAVKLLTGVLHITSMHGWIQNTLKQKIGTWLDKRFIRTAKKVIVVSHKMRDLAKNIGIENGKIVTLRNGVLLDDYPLDYQSEKITKEYLLPQNKVIIGIIGRLSEEKGQVDFVRIAGKVLSQRDNCHFIVVGDGPLTNEVQSEVDRLRVREHFTFTGHRTDMLDIYSAIDILAITSYTEGLPNVLLEAFALSKAVVSTDVGGVSEVLHHDVNGCLANPGDIELIANHLIRLVNDEQLRKRFGRQGRMTIEKEFNFRKRVEKMEALYDSIL